MGETKRFVPRKEKTSYPSASFTITYQYHKSEIHCVYGISVYFKQGNAIKPQNQQLT